MGVVINTKRGRNAMKKFKHFLSPKFVTKDDGTEYMWYGHGGLYYWFDHIKGNRP